MKTLQLQGRMKIDSPEQKQSKVSFITSLTVSHSTLELSLYAYFFFLLKWAPAVQDQHILLEEQGFSDSTVFLLFFIIFKFITQKKKLKKTKRSHCDAYNQTRKNGCQVTHKFHPIYYLVNKNITISKEASTLEECCS